MFMLSKKVRQILADGIALSVPIGIILYLVIWTLGMLEKAVAPLAERLGVQTLFGGMTLTVLSLLLMAVFVLLMGLIMQIGFVSRMRDGVESVILRFLPSLNHVKTLVGDMIDREHAMPGWRSVVLKLHDTHCFAFLVEETSETGVFFHLKGTNLTTGEILILDKGGYNYTFVETEEMRRCLKHFGKGAAALIRS